MSLGKNVGFLLLGGLLLYAPEVFAKSRGCGPDGCGAWAGVALAGVVFFGLYCISRVRKIPWLGLIPHALIIGGTAFAAAGVKGAGAAFAAFVISITIVHAYFKISNAKSQE